MQFIIDVIRHFGDVNDARDKRIFYINHYTKGNIVELGCGHGDLTAMLCNHTSRKIIGIDPYNQKGHESYWKPYDYNYFASRMLQYPNFMFLRLESTDPILYDILPAHADFGMFIVDGLQDFDTVYSDLKLAAHFSPEVICVDDINRTTEICKVPAAVETFMRENPEWKLIKTEREGYLWK